MQSSLATIMEMDTFSLKEGGAVEVCNWLEFSGQALHALDGHVRETITSKAVFVEYHALCGYYSTRIVL